MYKKILWYARKHTDKPLSYSLLVACIFHEKCDPEPYYNEKMVYKKDQFFEDCKKPNQFAGNISGIETEFKSNSGIELSDLIGSEIWQEIIEMDSIYDFIEKKIFNSQYEIKKLCEKIYSEYLDEKALTDQKKIMAIYGKRGVALSTQMWNLCRNIDAKERWADSTANLYWFGSNAIRCITERLRKIMNVEQSPDLYLKAAIDLKECFGFSNLQIEMLKYFICQSRDGDCPSHKNKAIYIWGDNKNVGKTTIASTIVCILNGEKDISNARLYKSSMAQELGWESHTAPMICSCRAVLMDEAMPKDSSKSYGTFKDRITSDGVKVRFVFKNQIDIDAKANYVFTSNDPLEYFVQDKKERRFLEYHIEKKYSNLTYEKIYDVFLKFIQQCKRDRDWVEWSESMSDDTEVKGIESKDIDDIRSFFETASFATEIKNGASQVSIGTFYQHVFKFDKNASKQTIRECIVDMFGEPVKPSTWKKLDILEILKDLPGYKHITDLSNNIEDIF